MNVFDFDNTIYRGESFVDLFIMVLKKDPTLLKNVPHMVSGVAQYKLGTLRLETALEKYAGIFEEYVSGLDDLDSLVNEFWDRHIHKVKPFYMDVKSEDDIVISASPEIVIADLFSPNLIFGACLFSPNLILGTCLFSPIFIATQLSK